jgi:hypothetical protein
MSQNVLWNVLRNAARIRCHQHSQQHQPKNWVPITTTTNSNHHRRRTVLRLSPMYRIKNDPEQTTRKTATTILKQKTQPEKTTNPPMYLHELKTPTLFLKTCPVENEQGTVTIDLLLMFTKFQ